MKVTITIECETQADVADVLQKLSGNQPEQLQKVPDIVKPKPVQQTVAANAAKPNTTAATEPVDDKPVQTVTLAEIRAVIRTGNAAGKKEQMKPLLTKYGASDVTSIKPEDYPAFFADLNTVVNG